MNEVAEIRNSGSGFTLITERSVNTPKPDRSVNRTVVQIKYMSRHQHLQIRHRRPDFFVGPGGSQPQKNFIATIMRKSELSRQCFTCNLASLIALCFILFTSLMGAEEVGSLLWHGAKLIVEVPDNLVRVDNADSDIAKILEETKPESYTLLFSFVDGKSLKAASETRLNGDSAPLPYATITVPRAYLIPGRSPSMTPAEMVQAMKMHMANEKAKGPGASNCVMISQSEHHVSILTRSQVERKVGGKLEKKDMANISSHINAGKFFVMIGISSLWTNESDAYNLSLINDKLRKGLKIVLDNP